MKYESVIDLEAARIEALEQAEQQDFDNARITLAAIQAIKAIDLTPGVLVLLLDELSARIADNNFKHEDFATAAIESMDDAAFSLKKMDRS